MSFLPSLRYLIIFTYITKKIKNKNNKLQQMHTRYGGPSELKALKSCGKNNALTIMSSEDLMEEDDLMLDCNELNVDEIENEID